MRLSGLVQAGIGTTRWLIVMSWNSRTCNARRCTPNRTLAHPRRPPHETDRAINSDVEIKAMIDDVDADTIRALAADCDLIIDGLDNFETRFLVNDYSVATGTPWIYGGAIGTTGMSAVVLPGDTPCLRCLFPEPPASGTTPTCDTAGVLGPVIHRVAAQQAMQAIKLLTGNITTIDRTLQTFDTWSNTQHAMASGERRADCPCCGEDVFDWLDGRRVTSTMELAGAMPSRSSHRVDTTICRCRFWPIVWPCTAASATRRRCSTDDSPTRTSN